MREMSQINQVLLKSKFRGCILGALVGDCFGAPFEGDVLSTSSKLVLQRYFDKLDGEYFKAPVKKYTKNSSMTKCVAQCLLDEPKRLEPTKLAKLFVREFFRDPKRGYEDNLASIFHKLRANKFADPFKPASEQAGVAVDNGAAMRISPIALYYNDNYKEMLNAAKVTSEITHTHSQGVTGAVFQCVAVQQALSKDPKTQIDQMQFTNDLISKLKEIEKDEEGYKRCNPKAFTDQMKIVQELLEEQQGAPDEDVVEQLGHSMLALYSVPTAIYSFLRAQKEIENIETSNPFRRTLQYAISLGGDTATIASMAGSIAGAYFGEEHINKSLQYHCEEYNTFRELADGLFNQKYEH